MKQLLLSTLLAVSLSLPAAAQVAPPGMRLDSRRLPRTVAGGEITLAFESAIDWIHAETGRIPLACELAQDGKRATCPLPTTLTPGSWLIEIEYRVGEQHFEVSAVAPLRVPSILAIEPAQLEPGEYLELELEAPLNTDSHAELVVMGLNFERTLETRQLSPTRLRARLPRAESPPLVALVLRAQGEESDAYKTYTAPRWLRMMRAYVRWIPYGLGAGVAIALVVIVSQPKRRRSA